jgi:hypothetical protein
VAHFDRAVPPGGEGKIKLTIRTKGYQGTLHKSATVYTNDPVKKTIRLSLKGFVKVPIIVSPRQVRLYGQEGKILTRLVEVRAELDEPLILTPAQFSLTGKLNYSIEEIEQGKRFQIRFTTTPGSPQAYRGFLRLKTNYPEKPEITVWIKVRIQKRADAQKPTGSPQQ